jgi:hypothetical protein
MRHRIIAGKMCGGAHWWHGPRARSTNMGPKSTNSRPRLLQPSGHTSGFHLCQYRCFGLRNTAVCPPGSGKSRGRDQWGAQGSHSASEVAQGHGHLTVMGGPSGQSSDTITSRSHRQNRSARVVDPARFQAEKLLPLCTARWDPSKAIPPDLSVAFVSFPINCLYIESAGVLETPPINPGADHQPTPKVNFA